MASQAEVSYTAGTANKQRFLLHWQAKYIVANNLPANDAHWDSDDPAWVGKASMSKHHRFLIRRNLHWRWFNALVFGMLDENDMVYPHGQCCREAVAELNMMKDAALAWVAGVRSEEGWSENVGLFFHCYGHNSVNSLHLHVIDMDYIGPSFHSQEFKNLPLEEVLKDVDRTPINGTLATMDSHPAIDESVDLKAASVKACPVINNAESFRAARENFWKLGGPPGSSSGRAWGRTDGCALNVNVWFCFMQKKESGSSKLTTSTKPFNVFARLAYQDTVARTLIASESGLSKLTKSR
ncbi:unnamed protein product [Durusdinium trenchii]|uniref:HIT domain-containing protein n=1 Tax=Durusdinium trenchii TaxID=1381693 RepID=A0ABP0JW92_9DINO